MTTIQYVAATGCALVMFVLAANLLVDLYARGVVRAAVDEGVRAGAAVDATPARCAARARSVLADLLGEAARRGVRVSCTEGFGAVAARADVRLESWLAFVPDWTFTVVATAVKERDR